MSGAVTGPDGRARCPWGLSTPDYVDYHDTEWGRPVHGTAPLYERLVLEAFQSGLAWITILRKRPAFREAFAGFDPHAVAAFDDADVARLLADPGIVRNRAKIEAAVGNARAVVALEEGGEDLDALLWSFAPEPRPAPQTLADVPATTPESAALARELKRCGFRFVGPTTAYALMQATGMVDDHLAGCWARGGRSVDPAAG
ncbi:MAG TPA: DNA-3-methyladenine glycosylase I [Motilibacteraceae bacterium]|nr:DNA-3-methyladenine glycosylase I [Motilibacteraceae bacterium]